MRLFVAAMAGLALLASVAQADESKVDGSTPETTSASLHAITGQHSNREICLLQAALINITVGENDKHDAAADKSAPTPSLGSIINGMTYDEVIDKSRDYPSKITALCRD
ncbi:MAG TPA: hypothetical protein VGF56_16560 [Rhizomicrobium sp.]|jgi:hypothetical protein